MLFDSINRTDLDLRPNLYGTIILSGGTTLSKGTNRTVGIILTLVAGFGQRVKNEMEKLAVKGTKIKIFAPPERKYTTWIGGSILAALGTFRKVPLHTSNLWNWLIWKMWVSAEEYQEDPEIIHRKAI
jgi:centractin